MVSQIEDSKLNKLGVRASKSPRSFLALGTPRIYRNLGCIQSPQGGSDVTDRDTSIS